MTRSPRLRPSVAAMPDYDRSQPAGVVHLGIGAFHRAHQAVYFDRLLSQGETGWMIRGASLRSAGVADQLNPQAGLYTCVEQDRGGEVCRIVGSVRDVLVGPADPRRLVAAMAHPDIALVTLTITEKGYELDPGTGALNLDSAAVRHDVEHPDNPQTGPGYLVAALARRRAEGLAPFTILSCDNLPENGHRTRAAVLELARKTDPGLADWIADTTAFPCSMVDRIVPATTEADIEALAVREGYHDAGMVKAEAFSQWVVEDRFCNRRPPLERVGVEMAPDVAPWERIKLRLLNGAHSALAYLGGLAGYTHVHEAIADPHLRAFVDALWDEVEPTLDRPAGFDAAVYRQALLDRFANPALAHRLHQIAMDGSQKLPQRLLATLADRRAGGRNSPALELAIAAWMRWQGGEDARGNRFTVDDPMADRTRPAFMAGGGDPRRIVANLLAMDAVFAPEIAADQDVRDGLSAALGRLLQSGDPAVMWPVR